MNPSIIQMNQSERTCLTTSYKDANLTPLTFQEQLQYHNYMIQIQEKLYENQFNIYQFTKQRNIILQNIITAKMKKYAEYEFKLSQIQASKQKISDICQDVIRNQPKRKVENDHSLEAIQSFDKIKLKYDQSLEQTKRLDEISYKLEQAIHQSSIQSNYLDNQIIRWTLEEENCNRNIKYLEEINQEKEAELKSLINLRGKLNNQLQEIKGNIRVYCRIRPSHEENVVVQSTESTVKIKMLKQNYKNADKVQSTYNFEYVFNAGDSQDMVFSELSQLILNSLDGFNVCIFAYGQTGSGKTYTLHGPEQQYFSGNRRGITSRSMQLVFDNIKQKSQYGWQFVLHLSIVQIYMNKYIDLIGCKETQLDKQRYAEVNTLEDVLTYLKETNANRKVASTQCNQRSSRSHLVVTLQIQSKDDTGRLRSNALTLVDLAGSQRLKQSKAEGENLKETMSINTSLSALGKVIGQLKRKDQHIAFRDNKLTHWLQKYLDGNSRTLMFVNISPDQRDAAQTLISLRFAEGVRDAKLKKM